MESETVDDAVGAASTTEPGSRIEGKKAAILPQIGVEFTQESVERR